MITFRDDDIGFNNDINEFKAIHEIFNKYKVIHTIAVIAKDIDQPKFSPLVRYIRKQKNIDVQLHCWEHTRVTPKEFSVQLPQAIDKIQKVFGRPMVFYPPWNEVAPWMIATCKENNIIINASKISLSQYLRGVRGETINFHYWSDECKDLEAAIIKSLK